MSISESQELMCQKRNKAALRPRVVCIRADMGCEYEQKRVAGTDL